MLMEILLLAIGFAILIKSADFFIESVVSMAKWLGISEFFIGVTVVSVGTSLPELGTSIVSLFHNTPGIIIGNVIGANILDMSIVIAIAALIGTLFVQRDIISYDLPALLTVSFLFWMFATDGSVVWFEGLIFLIVYFAYTLAIGERRVEIGLKKVFEKRKMIFLFISLIGVLLGAELVVSSALQISKEFDLATTLVGLTIVSIGTTLPELITSALSAWKGERELALGNITGSVLFNLCIVLGFPALFIPIPVGSAILSLSFPIMVALALILGVMALDKQITRFDGVVLLAVYITFLTLLI